MKLLCNSLLIVGCFSSLRAELISMGVKGGVPVTDVVEAAAAVSSEARPYTVGPMAQIALPLSFAVEVDALYKRIGYSALSTATATSGTFVRVRANSWEFPILLK
jgi:hypothetical protein